MEQYVPYRAYLIRIWPTRRGGVAGYRATAEDVNTGECRHFPDLESLLSFLKVKGNVESEDSSKSSGFFGETDP